jgi:hypothetical protein
MLRSTYARGLFIRKLAAATQDGKNHSFGKKNSCES